MKNQVKKFLEFNGKVIYFIAADGQYWIALKPICEALNVGWKKQHEGLLKDEILSQLSTEQGMVAADGKLRKMVSLPESFIYGWIFQIQSNSPELLKFKWECYRILFEHFHGAIGGRKDLLKEKARASIEIGKLLTAEQALTLDRAKRRINAINVKLRKMDDDIIEEEKTLFDTI